MKAGFIGYRGFAGKLSRLFEETGRVKTFLFYHPEKTIPGLNCTRDLRDLLDSDFIVIASPDWSHGEYLRKLRGYKGYIFCEKIPVTKREDLKNLMNNPNGRLYFNFNYRKSRLMDILFEHSKDILYISARLGYGIALKEGYRENWRGKPDKARLGVFQLTGIHFMDLVTFPFGRPIEYFVSARNKSPFGKTADNFRMGCEFANGIMSDLFLSYTSPYNYRIEIITTDSLLEITETEYVVRGPRDTFDSKGMFSLAPVIKREKIALYDDSLRNSVGYFLETVVSGGDFPEASHTNNLLSTELFMDISERVKDIKND